jgi:hypothetical protein
MSQVQKERLEKLFNLIREHPELQVKFLVTSEEVSEDHYSIQRILSIELSPWLVDRETILTDEENMDECFYEQIEETEDFPRLTDAEIEQRIKDKHQQMVSTVILVKMGA